MIFQEEDLIKTTNLEARRAFMKLSVDERRRILALQADEIAEHYEGDAQSTEREQWQGGDIVEY
jgi:acyl-CoA reductase-like NAD-dependent aldehyde dehydrogenase